MLFKFQRSQLRICFQQCRFLNVLRQTLSPDPKRNVTAIVLLQLGEAPTNLPKFYRKYYSRLDCVENLSITKWFIDNCPVLSRLVKKVQRSDIPAVYKDGTRTTAVVSETAKALQANLDQLMPELAPFSCQSGFVFSPPTLETAFHDLEKKNVERVVLLPIYPQYWCFQSGSCLNECAKIISKTTVPADKNAPRSVRKFIGLKDQHFALSPSATFSIIDRFPGHPSIIDTFVSIIQTELESFPYDVRNDVAILFVAPYWMSYDSRTFQREVAGSALRISEGLNHRHPYELALFPSWQNPFPFRPWRRSVKSSLKRFVRSQRPNVLVVPLTFLTDNLDSVYTLPKALTDKKLRKIGVHHIRIAPAPNTHPILMHGLAELVKNHLLGDGRPGAQLSFRCPFCISKNCIDMRNLLLS